MGSSAIAHSLYRLPKPFSSEAVEKGVKR